jgi:hypothetical protein
MCNCFEYSNQVQEWKPDTIQEWKPDTIQEWTNDFNFCNNCTKFKILTEG